MLFIFCGPEADDSVIMSLKDKEMCALLDHWAFKIPEK